MTGTTVPNEPERSLQRWILGALVVLGALLRLTDLGTLAFRWDEDLSSLAAKAIAERGVPELPSGMIYLRAVAFLYLLASSGELLGFSEWALRLPAVVFGVAAIPLSFAFGKRLFGASTGLILAALVTFSVWDIEFSRYARMYAPFEFFYLLTLLGIWQYRIVEPSRAGGALCIAAALLAVSLHDLGYTLAIAFLVPPLLLWNAAEEPRGRLFDAAAAALVAAFFLVWRRVQNHYFNRAARLAAETEAAGPIGAAEAGDVVQPDGDGSGWFESIFDIVQRILSQLRLPDLPAFSALSETLPLAAAAFLFLPLLAVLVFCFRRLPASSWPVLGAIALCSGLQLFNLALLGMLALAFIKRQGVRGFRAPDCVFAFALIAVSFSVWLGATLRFDLLAAEPGGNGTTARDAVRQLLNYPSFFVFWGFPNEYRLMSLPAAIGGLWAFDRAARERPSRAAAFLLAVFAIPMISNGLFETRYQSFRYNVPFNPLFFTFVALGILKWREVLEAWRAAPARLGRTPRASITALLVLAVAAIDMNPLRGWLATQRAYDNEGPLYGFFDLRGFRDYRSAAGYVSERAAPIDTIIAFDCREYFNYLGQLDYCIVSRTYLEGKESIQTYVKGGVLRDLYLSTPMITSTEELEEVLHRARGTAWLLASDSMTRNPDRVGKELMRFIENSASRVVHVAPDGETKVYRF